MKTVLVLQHVPHEGPGSLTPLLQIAGFRIHTLQFWNDAKTDAASDDLDGLIVMGGPMGVYDADQYSHLIAEKAIIQRAIKNNVPVLGICLGAQLIADALGAKVYPSGIKEIGWYDLVPAKTAETDPLFRGFTAREKVFQWHGDTFDLPQGAIHLASSPLCANQAFRYGSTVYGLQFHLEVDAATIENWLNVPQNRAEVAALEEKVDVEVIRFDTNRYIRRLTELGNSVFGAFLRLLDNP